MRSIRRRGLKLLDKSDFPTAFSTDDKWEFRPESLPPIAYERPMHSEDIFYKKDPVFRIKARSHYLWAPTIVMCGLFFGFLYIVIFETPDSNDIKIRLIFAIFLFGFIFACLVRELIKRRDPVVAEVYDTGIWLNDYGVFTPYEKFLMSICFTKGEGSFNGPSRSTFM